MLLIVLLTALCGIIYELLLSALSSYLLGNSIVQFSITIGFFLFGLGIGSYLSKYIKKLEKNFIFIEIILAILGAFSVIFIKRAYIYLSNYVIFFEILYIFYVVLIGFLVGMEIPIIASILDKKNKNIQNTIGDVFSFDYVGSLIGTLLFPFILLPWLGLTYTAFAVGILNLIVAFLFIIYISKNDSFTQNLKKLLLLIFTSLLLILGAIFANQKIDKLWDHFFYKEPIVYSEHSKYQKIVLTKRGKDVRLYLNGHLQFLSLDENRYHTALTYFPRKFINSFTGNKLSILVLGGGDGLAVRNLISYIKGFEYLKGKKLNWKITLVDLDPDMTKLAKTNTILLKINKGSLNNSNVKVINDDAFRFLQQNHKKYDIIIADFPDPRNIELSKLYSKEFYAMILKHLKNRAVFTTQSSSAFFSKEAFWCINKTMKSLIGTGFKVIPYHTYLPSFGDWGFNSYLKNINFKTNGESLSGLIQFEFDKDYLISGVNENTLDKPVIIQYYLKGRRRYSE